MGVFVGGTALADLEAVAARAGDRSDGVVASLETLVEHSLVVAEGTGRLRLLEPVAQYARALLRGSGEWEAAARAHAAHYLAVAEEHSSSYRNGGQVAALTRIDLEHANLTAAAERSLAMGDVETPARMAWELWLYWWLRGHHDHGRRFAENVLQRSEALSMTVHGRAALAAATMAFAMDDMDAAEGWWVRAHEHAADDPVILSNAIAGEGLVALVSGDLSTARGHFEDAVVHAEGGGDEVEWTWALAHIWLGTVALLGGDADEAVRLIEAGLGSARRRDDRLTSYIALYNLFQVELGRGDNTAARRPPGGRHPAVAGDGLRGQPGLPPRRRCRPGGGLRTTRARPAAPRRRPGHQGGTGLARLRLLPAGPGDDRGRCGRRPHPPRLRPLRRCPRHRSRALRHVRRGHARRHDHSPLTRAAPHPHTIRTSPAVRGVPGNAAREWCRSTYLCPSSPEEPP